jgi:hypothetical protein
MILAALKKRLRRWLSGSQVTPYDVYPFMLEKEIHELAIIGRDKDLGMELLDSYINARNDGFDPAEAKQEAMREWDL